MASLTPESITLQLTLAEVDLALLRHIDTRLAAAGLAIHALSELQRTAQEWLSNFTDLDNGTRAGRSDARGPRSVVDMQARLAELELDADACFVAIADNEWVGYTLLDPAHSEPGVLLQSWTGVLPAWRRQGIASGLKLRAIRYALAHDYRILRTAARSANAASIGLNRRLGFRSMES